MEGKLMSKLVLIDHSLKGVGGHHFEYAYHILSEAEQRGWSIVLATHRNFQQTGELPASWQVLPVFSNDTYSPHCVYFRYPYSSDKKSAPAKKKPASTDSANESLWRRLLQWWTGNRQQAVRTSFAGSCSELFSQAPLTAGDEVFIPTLSELDLAGLVDFLQQSPQPPQINWRLQFHFDVCDGRPHEFASQSARGESMRRSMADSLTRAPHTRFHFYNTTSELTAQYNRLQAAPFETLHYPVNPRFTPRAMPAAASAATGASGRLRVTCGGYFRREKGRRRFAGLISNVAPDLLASRSIQISAQCRERQMNKILRSSHSGASGLPAGSVVCAPHPLGVDEYVEYIRQSDIGLFLYDGRRYFSRCSGVLVEMLAAGVPVITPAACWLEEQFTAANQQYLREIINEVEPVGATSAGRFTVGCNNADGDQHARNTPRLDTPRLDTPRLNDAADLMLSLKWPESSAELSESKFVRLICHQLDSSAAILDSYQVVLRSNTATSRAMLPLDDRCRSVRVCAAPA